MQSKVSKAQKIKGLLNVFDIYDHTNNQMWTHFYKQKTGGKQFLDFIKKVDQKYNDTNIKKIFLILDNASIHKSNKVKEILSRYHPRIQLVFLPTTRSPDLNLIEVRWMWMHRQAINNSTFENEQDVGKAVSSWTYSYNKKHAGKTSIISLQEESIHVFT
ncbi:MAG: transposase [Candidatus Nitrosocosmicus sp.]